MYSLALYIYVLYNLSKSSSLENFSMMHFLWICFETFQKCCLSWHGRPWSISIPFIYTELRVGSSLHVYYDPNTLRNSTPPTPHSNLFMAFCIIVPPLHFLQYAIFIMDIVQLQTRETLHATYTTQHYNWCSLVS